MERKLGNWELGGDENIILDDLTLINCFFLLHVIVNLLELFSA